MTRARLTLLPALAGALLVAAPAAASGQPATKAAAKERAASTKEVEALLARLHARDPQAALLFAKANHEANTNHLAQAVADYQAVLARVPDFDPAARSAAEVDLWMGKRDDALRLARSAYRLRPSTKNTIVLAHALASFGRSSQPAPEADQAMARTLARQALTADHEHTPWIVLDAGKVALFTHDTSLLHRASTALARLDPGSQRSLLLAFYDDAFAGHYEKARALLPRLRAAGLGDKDLANLRQQIDKAEPYFDRHVQPHLGQAVIGVLAWLGGLAFLLLGGFVLSTLVLASARRVPTGEHGAVGSGDRLLRRVYRAVMWLSCVYYYASVPLVILAVVALGGGLIYGFFAVGEIPIQIVLIIGLLVLVTAWAGLKSLFVRGVDADPGWKLDLSTEPALASALAEVAERVGTRPVDAVYLTPGTEVAVTERGGMLDQIRGGRERCLILGLGVLDALTVAELKSVLAHEYGHLVDEDTAGGGFALAVRRSLQAMAIGLARGGAATWYNPAWWFINGFHRAFMRISQGASRLQEILADRWAAFAYGSKHFEAGLSKVIAQTIRFDAHVGSTLGEVVQQKRPLPNLYRYAPEKEPSPDEVRAAVDERFQAAPSPYDSHPRPADRIEWVRAIDAPDRATEADKASGAWSLFTDRESLEETMTTQVREGILANHGIAIAAGAPCDRDGHRA